MERFFITAEEAQVEDTTMWWLFFDCTLKKESPSEKLQINSIQNYEEHDTKSPV